MSTDDSRSKLIRSFLASGESNSSFQDRAPSIFPTTSSAPNSPGRFRSRSMIVSGPATPRSSASTSSQPVDISRNSSSASNEMLGWRGSLFNQPSLHRPQAESIASSPPNSTSTTIPISARRSGGGLASTLTLNTQQPSSPRVSGMAGSLSSPGMLHIDKEVSTPAAGNSNSTIRGGSGSSAAPTMVANMPPSVSSLSSSPNNSFFGGAPSTPRGSLMMLPTFSTSSSAASPAFSLNPSTPLLGRSRTMSSDDDFSTVDWTRENEREKHRKKELLQSKSTGGCWTRVKQFFLAGQGWLLLALIGLTLGVTASMVQLTWTWLDSIRVGYCAQNIFLNQASCCGCSILTGGSAIADSALHPPPFTFSPSTIPTSTPSPSASSSVHLGNSSLPGDNNLIQLGSVDCGNFRTWVQVYRSWTTPSSDQPDSGGSSGGNDPNNGANSESDDGSTTFWTGASPAFWFAYAVYVLSGCLMALLGVWLVTNFSTYARASGLPEIKTILGGVVMKKFLGAWTLFIKLIGMVLAVASGLIVGIEGPFIHIACCIANIISRLFPKFYFNEAKKREVLSAASAAGIAVTFGAPVGGVLFSLEELSSYFPHKTLWRSFFCAVMSILAVAFIDPLQTGQLVWFKIEFKNTWLWVEMVPFCLLGVLGGVVGALMIKLNIWVARKLETTRWGQNPLSEILFVAAVTNLVRFPFVLLRGSTYHFLSALFSDCRRPDLRLDMLCNADAHPWESVLMLALFGMLLAVFVCFTFGSWIPGGIFIPSLLIGACFGRAFGILMSMLYSSFPNSPLFYFCSASSSESCITPGIYAIVGAASVLGGVTRMTVSLAVIMFELTGGLNYALPIVSAIMFAKWIGDAFSPDSIHDKYISLYQFPHLDHKSNVPATNITVRDVMSQNLVVLTMHGHTVESLRTIIKEFPLSGYPVVTTEDEMLLVGYTSRADLTEQLNRACQLPQLAKASTRCYFAAVEMRFPRNAPFVDLTVCTDNAPVQVVDDMSFERVFHMFRTLGLGYCLITKFGKLVGVLTKKDVIGIMTAPTSG